MKTEYVAGKASGTLDFSSPNDGAFRSSREDFFSVELNSEKTSVNTGKFIPGVYRVNPYSVWKENCGRGGKPFADKAFEEPWTYASQTAGDTAVFFGNWAKSLASSAPSYSNWASVAVQKAAAKLGGSEAGLGETLGELRETLNLLRHPFKDLRDFFLQDNLKNLGLYNRIAQYAKSGVWGERGGTALRGSKAASVAANSWLELRYGLMPLIYTVQDLIKLANKAALKFDRDKIRSVRASVKQKVETPLLAKSFGAQICSTEFLCTVSGTDSVTVRASIQYHLDSPRTMRELLGLTPASLPELAWELTRLSFVVDWWLSVGDWLGAFRGLFLEPTIKVLGNTVGYKVDRKVLVNASSRVAGLGPIAPLTPRGEVGYYTLTSYVRNVNESIPILPQFKPEFKSILHSVDALALILQPLMGKLKR